MSFKDKIINFIDALFGLLPPVVMGLGIWCLIFMVFLSSAEVDPPTGTDCFNAAVNATLTVALVSVAYMIFKVLSLFFFFIFGKPKKESKLGNFSNHIVVSIFSESGSGGAVTWIDCHFKGKEKELLSADDYMGKWLLFKMYLACRLLAIWNRVPVEVVWWSREDQPMVTFNKNGFLVFECDFFRSMRKVWSSRRAQLEMSMKSLLG